jgi:hypothetical protein
MHVHKESEHVKQSQLVNYFGTKRCDRTMDGGADTDGRDDFAKTFINYCYTLSSDTAL